VCSYVLIYHSFYSIHPFLSEYNFDSDSNNNFLVIINTIPGSIDCFKTFGENNMNQLFNTLNNMKPILVEWVSFIIPSSLSLSFHTHISCCHNSRDSFSLLNLLLMIFSYLSVFFLQSYLPRTSSFIQFALNCGLTQESILYGSELLILQGILSLELWLRMYLPEPCKQLMRYVVMTRYQETLTKLGLN
jgi:hypothetical protein